MTATEKRWASLAADDIASDALPLCASGSRTRTVPLGAAARTDVCAEADRTRGCGRNIPVGDARINGCTVMSCSKDPARFPAGVFRRRRPRRYVTDRRRGDPVPSLRGLDRYSPAASKQIVSLTTSPGGDRVMASRQRFVVPLLVASWVGLVVAGCSESDASEAADTRPQLSKIDIPYAELSVTVNGQPLPGIDPAEFMCYRQSDSISITGQDPTDGQPGLIADLQPGNPPKLVRVSFGLDGVLYTAKRGKGLVEDVDEDGSRITVRGTAESWDLAVPITKQFEFSATCN